MFTLTSFGKWFLRNTLRLSGQCLVFLGTRLEKGSEQLLLPPATTQKQSRKAKERTVAETPQPLFLESDLDDFEEGDTEVISSSGNRMALVDTEEDTQEYDHDDNICSDSNKTVVMVGQSGNVGDNLNKSGVAHDGGCPSETLDDSLTTLIDEDIYRIEIDYEDDDPENYNLTAPMIDVYQTSSCNQNNVDNRPLVEHDENLTLLEDEQTTNSIYMFDFDDIVNNITGNMVDSVESKDAEQTVLHTPPMSSADSMPQVDSSPSLQDSMIVCYNLNSSIQETQAMGSVLKSLTVSRIPMDSDNLTINVKWELNARKRAELFISQGEVGEVSGQVVLTRQELKNFTSEGREAYLVYWLEGIESMTIMVDVVPPLLKDIEMFMIKEASVIVENRIASINQFRESILNLSDGELERNLYYYIRQVHLIQSSDYHDESLEESWGSFLSNLQKKETIERSHWISQHGDEYIKFLDTNQKLETNIVSYVNQRLNVELPGFYLADQDFKYKRHTKGMERFKKEILAVEGVLPYLSFEIATIFPKARNDVIIGIVGDGYLGRYTVYKPLERNGQLDSKGILNPSEYELSLSPMYS